MLLECAAFCFLWEIFVICQQSLPLQFIPARGRKQFLPVRQSVPFHCNLSPRGDENLTSLILMSAIGYCNLSPRGDENFLSLKVFA